MKVYLVYEDNGSRVDRVFDRIDLARLYVVTDYMAERAKTESELNKLCDKHIEEHEVLTNL